MLTPEKQSDDSQLSLLDRLEALPASLADRVERFSQNRILVERSGSVAAGFCVGVLSCKVSAMGDEQVNIQHCAKLFLFALISYPLVAVLLGHYWRGSLERLIPRWILTAAFGSFLFATLNTTSNIISGWVYPERAWPSWSEYVWTQVESARTVMIIFSLLALGLTGGFSYAGETVKAVRRWHSGSEPLSIVNKDQH